MKIQSVSVIGAGVMGRGVSQNLAQTGHRVILIDVKKDILDSARQEIRTNIRFQGFFSGNKPRGNPDDILRRIEFSTEIQLLKDADFVIENVPEKCGVKRDIYRELDRVCPMGCVIAANTSAISITLIASWTKRPSKIIGMHFMNPVQMKAMVEVIRGYHTSDETIEIAQSVLTSMGKEWIVVNDSPGFVTNRVLMVMINEAIYLLHDHVAPAQDIDRMFKTCFGHKMGPLETADLIGLDTILFTIEVLYENFADSKYRPCPLLRRMVDAGLHGRKSGRGFYDYNIKVE